MNKSIYDVTVYTERSEFELKIRANHGGEAETIARERVSRIEPDGFIRYIAVSPDLENTF